MVDDLEVVTIENKESFLKGAKWYVKKPVPVRAVKLTRPVVVKTLEGSLLACEGDYLVEGVKGEVYPVSSAIFEETYQEVENALQISGRGD